MVRLVGPGIAKPADRVINGGVWNQENTVGLTAYGVAEQVLKQVCPNARHS